MKVLLVDNYDSFTFNLYQQIAGLGVTVRVARNDEIDLRDVREWDPTHIVLSPGPGRPDRARDFGVCAEILQSLDPGRPVLGVCLGHQGIVLRFGGRIERAARVVHGKRSQISHCGRGLFAGVTADTPVMRYHSLAAVETALPDCLEITARSTDDDMIMAVSHRELPVHGVQFHPESFGTPDGGSILANFLGAR